MKYMQWVQARWSVRGSITSTSAPYSVDLQVLLLSSAAGCATVVDTKRSGSPDSCRRDRKMYNWETQ